MPTIDHMNLPIFLVVLPLGFVSATYFPLGHPVLATISMGNPLYHLAEGLRGIACAVSPSSLYISLRDRGIVRLAFARLEVEPLPQALLGATIRSVLGLATGSVGGRGAVYAVTGDDAVYRFTACGEPDRRLELDLLRTSGR